MSQWRWGSGLSIASIATVILVIWTIVQSEDEVVTPRSERGSSASRKARVAPSENESVKKGEEPVEKLRLDYLVRENTSIDKKDPFARSTWEKPPSPKKAAAPPPPPEPVVVPVPTAPPLPFSYFGRYEDGSKRIVLLLKDSKIYTVTEGVNIESNYRVVKVEENKIDIVYLPLGIVQSIDIGEGAFAAGK